VQTFVESVITHRLLHISIWLFQSVLDVRVKRRAKL